MRLLPAQAAGPDNDLADLLDHYVQRAVNDQGVVAYVFGNAGARRLRRPTRCSGSRPATVCTTST